MSYWDYFKDQDARDGAAIQHSEELVRNFQPWYEMIRQADATRNVEVPADPMATYRPKEVLSTMSDAKGARTAFVDTWAKDCSDNFNNHMIRTDLIIKTRVTGDKAEQNLRSRFERAAYAAVAQLDGQVISRARGTSWRRKIDNSTFRRGKTVVMPHTHQNADGTVRFTAEVIDPMQVAHDLTEGPAFRFVHASWRTVAECKWVLQNMAAQDANKARREGREPYIAYGEGIFGDKGDKPDEVVPFMTYSMEEENDDGDGYWVWRGIYVNSRPVMPLRKTSLKRLPYKIVCMAAEMATYVSTPSSSGGAPPAGGTSPMTAQFVRDHARPMLEGMETNARQLSEGATLEMRAAGYMGLPPFVIERVDPMAPDWDASTIVKDLGPEGLLKPPPGWRITKLEYRAANLDTATSVYKKLEEQRERRYPSILHGRIAFAGEAGYMYWQRAIFGNVAINEHVQGDNLTVKETLTELFTQFFDREEARIPLGEKDMRGVDTGATVQKEFTSKDKPGSWEFEIRRGPVLPNDAARQADLFIKLTDRTSRGTSKLQGRSDFLEDQDPQQTESLIQQEEVEGSQIMVNDRIQSTAFQTMRELQLELAILEEKVGKARGDEKAKLVADLLAKKRLYYNAKQRYDALILAARGQAGATQAPRQGNFGAQTLPSEMGVGTNADQNAQAQGQVSSSLAGRPPAAGGTA